MRSPLIAAAALAAATLVAGAAEAQFPVVWPLARAQYYNWHGAHAHTEYGRPVAMVVPPTAQLQTTYSWGVGSSAVSRIDHQFGRHYSGPGPHGGPFQPTPVWPQSTTQFGVYHVRSAW